MSPPSRPNVPRHSPDHFYLPNLCRLNAVLPLILVGVIIGLFGSAIAMRRYLRV